MGNEAQGQFYAYLAEELIDSTCDSSAHSNSRRIPEEDVDRNSRSPGWGRAAFMHTSPQQGREEKLRMDCSQTGKAGAAAAVVKWKPSTRVNTCCDMGTGKDTWICHTQTGHLCFPIHVSQCHSGS